MNKPRVVVGIPAHNEERSIKKTLQASLNQKRDNFLLKNIVVYSDGSTDKTNKIVSEEKNKLIKLIPSNKAHGKTHGIKQLLKYASEKKADFLIIIDADLIIINNNIFNYLFNKISSDKNISAVSGYVSPLKPNNFVEKIGYFGSILWENMLKNSGKKELYFRSSDPLIMLQVKDFSQPKIKPYSYMHDEFYYLFCKKYGKTFAFEKKASAYFKLPNNFNDYVNQMLRYVSKHISDTEIKLLNNNGYSFSVKEKITKFIPVTKNNVLVGISYLFTQLYIYTILKMKVKRFNNAWQQITSTK